MTIEIGEHPVKATQWDLGESGKNRTPQIAVACTFTEGPNIGRTSTWFGFLTDAAFDRTVESLRHFGWKGDDLYKLCRGDDPEGMGTQEAVAVVGEEEYEGKLRARINFINGTGGLALKERMDDAQARAFAAKMRGRIMSKGSAKPATAQRSKPAGARDNSPPAHTDDDIPF